MRWSLLKTKGSRRKRYPRTYRRKGIWMMWNPPWWTSRRAHRTQRWEITRLNVYIGETNKQTNGTSGCSEHAEGMRSNAVESFNSFSPPPSLCLFSPLVSRQRGAPKPDPTQKVTKKRETTSVKVKHARTHAKTPPSTLCPSAANHVSRCAVINPGSSLSLQRSEGSKMVAFLRVLTILATRSSWSQTSPTRTYPTVHCPRVREQ